MTVKPSIFKIWPLRRFVLFTLIWASSNVLAQNDSLWLQKPDLTISGFADVYYVYDFNQPEEKYRQPYYYNHNRHNAVHLNLGLIKLALEHPRYRANLALQSGTYAEDNYSAEPELMRMLNEANIGLSLNKNNNLWLDAGILAAHTGMESAISIDYWTPTRSLVAEGSPFFLTGARLSHQPSDEWDWSVILCNGWQRIERIPGNSLPCFGSHLQHKKGDKWSINWNTLLGTDDPDSTRRVRYFNNLFAQYKLNDRFNLLAGFDIGAQQKIKNSSDYHYWSGAALLLQYGINERWKSTLRVEYYHDPGSVIVTIPASSPFKTMAYSMNLDYSPSPNLACRIEGRWLQSPDQIFEKQSESVRQNVYVTASLAIKFAQKLGHSNSLNN